MKIKKRKCIIISCLFMLLLFTTCIWRSFKKQTQEQIIPFQVLYGLPLVKVNIQGHTLKLVLDLGVHFSSLSKESMKRMPLTKLSKTINTMHVSGQKKIDPVFSASQVSIGNYLLPYLDFSASLSANGNSELELPKVLNYGKIGREPFLDKVLFIDRKRKMCIVKPAYLDQKIDPRKFSQGKWMEANFNLNQETGIGLCLIANLEEKKKLLLDTGANASYMYKNFLYTIPVNLRDQTENISLDLCNGNSLGTFPFYPLNCSVLGLQGILGFDFFNRYLVCIDFLNKKIFFKPYK